jgi:hypothetical protein
MKSKKIYLNVNGMSYRETLEKVSGHLTDGGYVDTLKLLNRESKTR